MNSFRIHRTKSEQKGCPLLEMTGWTSYMEKWVGNGKQIEINPIETFF